MIREAGSNARAGAVRCSASTCDAHIRSPIATRPSRGRIDATRSYGSSPSRQPTTWFVSSVWPAAESSASCRSSSGTTSTAAPSGRITSAVSRSSGIGP